MITYKMKTVMTFCFMFILRPGFAKYILSRRNKSCLSFILLANVYKVNTRYLKALNYC